MKVEGLFLFGGYWEGYWSERKSLTLLDEGQRSVLSTESAD